MSAPVLQGDPRPPFTWPPTPGPHVADIPAPAPSTTPPTTTPPWRRWLRAAERDLLAPTALPLAIRIADTGWSPDPPNEYCQRCGHSVGPHEPDEFGCAQCRNSRPPWAFAVRLGRYESHLAEWIREIKFHRNRWLAQSLGVELARALLAAGLPAEGLTVVPVPTSRRRRLSRGIDHTLALARGVARELDAPLARPIARRHRVSQLSVPVSARQQNVSGAFFARSPRRGIKQGGAVVLIDDVLTTGSTIRAACRALSEGGSKIPRERVWIGVAGVAVEPDRRSGGPDVENGA